MHVEAKREQGGIQSSHELWVGSHARVSYSGSRVAALGHVFRVFRRAQLLFRCISSELSVQHRILVFIGRELVACSPV